MRLIDADALKKNNWRLLHCDFPHLSEMTLEELIDEAPTIDAVPARHGHWIVNPKTQEGYCSECKSDMPVMMDDWHYKNLATEYCPSCGAKMYEEEP